MRWEEFLSSLKSFQVSKIFQADCPSFIPRLQTCKVNVILNIIIKLGDVIMKESFKLSPEQLLITTVVEKWCFISFLISINIWPAFLIDPTRNTSLHSTYHFPDCIKFCIQKYRYDWQFLVFCSFIPAFVFSYTAIPYMVYKH